ncbi:hypothetical protein GCM10027049_13020 [Mucilaginibacter puniceus]
MEAWVQNVLSKWKDEGVKVNDGVSLSEIEKAERILNFMLPEDFKAFYKAVNGFEDFEFIESWISLWSINRIIAEYNKENRFIMFSDFSLSVCQYGFDKENGDIYKAYSHHQQEPFEFLTKSFKEFIEFIDNDSELLF